MTLASIQTVISSDGSTIAYAAMARPLVILVGGAPSYRQLSKMDEIAAPLAERCMVVN